MSTPEFYAILTEAAMQLQFECLDSDKRFEMLEIAVGDGNGSYYEPEKTQTKLKNECYRAEISRSLTDEKGLVKSVILDIPEDVTGFTVREVGVFGADGALLIIGKYPEYTRHSNDSGAITQQAIKVDLAQINELVLPILIDPSINTASVQYVDENFQKVAEKGIANGYAPLDDKGFIPQNYTPNLADKDLSNLSEIGEKHFLNKTQITNCITEIPQRLKWGYSNGSIILYAGSELTVPDGWEDSEKTIRKFKHVKVAKDIDWDSTTATNPRYLFVINNLTYPANYSFDWINTGDTTPTLTSNYGLWYDTANNLVKMTSDKGTTWTSGLPFPCFTAKGNGTNFEYPTQVFNGMGFIAGALWLDKDIKALIPDELNTDGTYKNVEVVTDNVQILVNPHGINPSGSQALTLSANGIFRGCYRWVEAEIAPTTTSTYWYNPKTNSTHYSDDGRTWTNVHVGRIGKQNYTFSSGVNTFTSITANTALKLIDYNTMASGTAFRTVVDTYVNGTSWYRVWSDGWIEQGGYSTSTGAKTFLKPFSNTNYSMQTTTADDSTNANYYNMSVNSRTTTGFTIYMAGHGSKCFWRAEGY